MSSSDRFPFKTNREKNRLDQMEVHQQVAFARETKSKTTILFGGRLHKDTVWVCALPNKGWRDNVGSVSFEGTPSSQNHTDNIKAHSRIRLCIREHKVCSTF